MDWLAYVVGVITGLATSIVFYEYQRWRDRSESKKQEISKLKAEINNFVNEWEKFKKTEEMHFDPHLTEFQSVKLPKIADSLQKHALELKEKGIITKDIADKILEASNKIPSLSAKRFYLNGGKSWGEFISLGDEISKEFNKIKEKL